MNYHFQTTYFLDYTLYTCSEGKLIQTITLKETIYQFCILTKILFMVTFKELRSIGDDGIKHDLTYQYYTYWFILCATMIWIPIVIMCFAYTMIWLKVRKASKAFPYLSQQSRIARSRLKVIQMLFVLIIIELICWSPWQLVVIFDFILYPNYDLNENYPDVRYSISFKFSF